MITTKYYHLLSMPRKIHTGKNGGKYIMNKGQKRYLSSMSSNSNKNNFGNNRNCLPIAVGSEQPMMEYASTNYYPDNYGLAA